MLLRMLKRLNIVFLFFGRLICEIIVFMLGLVQDMNWMKRSEQIVMKVQFLVVSWEGSGQRIMFIEVSILMKIVVLVRMVFFFFFYCVLKQLLRNFFIRFLRMFEMLMIRSMKVEVVLFIFFVIWRKEMSQYIMMFYGIVLMIFWRKMSWFVFVLKDFLIVFQFILYLYLQFFLRIF